jgi:hypothetical protein
MVGVSDLVWQAVFRLLRLILLLSTLRMRVRPGELYVDLVGALDG